MQSSTLARLAPRGNYVLIGGSPSDSNAKILRDGQMRFLQAFIDRGDIKIVGDGWAKNWDPAEAYAIMSRAIESTKGDITAVVASNDGTAGGAIQALQEHKLAGKVLVSGQDADLAAIIRILDGTQTMTVYKSIALKRERPLKRPLIWLRARPSKMLFQFLTVREPFRQSFSALWWSRRTM